MASRRRAYAAVIAALLVCAPFAMKGVRWRAQVLILTATGQVPDIGLRDVISFIGPGAYRQSLEHLSETRNPYSVIQNLHVTAADLQAGSLLFRDQCASCHGPSAVGGLNGAPALAGRPLTHGESDWAIFRTIRNGVPGTPMQPHAFRPLQLWQLVTVIRAFQATQHFGSSTAGAPSIARPAVSVPYERLRDLQEPAEDWLTFSGSFRSTRHSKLTAIDPSNVSGLALRWLYHFDVSFGSRASPIVTNGLMYLTHPPAQMMALDAITGRRVWQYDGAHPDVPAENDSGLVNNRGAAILGNRVFFGTADARVIALSADTGKELWNVSVVDVPKVYSITSAPLAYKDLVVVGVATFHVGRAFVVALDAATGRERWRFVAIPGPGERGNDTWAGESWRTGGAPTWLTGSYDPELNLLYWGVGNPKPDYDASLRRGDNLYTDSVVALDGSTGKLRWYFQFTPADDHDWDSNQIPVLIDRTKGDRTEKLMLWANRNGFYYALNRVTGQFLHASAFVQQTWTDGIDANGRPKPRPQAVRNSKGSLQFPGNGGATNWWTPSYDSALNLFFVPVIEHGMMFFSTLDSYPVNAQPLFYTAVRALDADTGALVWERRNAVRTDDRFTGSLMTTAGGLLFGCDQSTFFALESKSGKLLWSVDTGGSVTAPPVTYTVAGVQYVAVAAATNLLVFSLPNATAAAGRGDDGHTVRPTDSRRPADALAALPRPNRSR